MDNKKAQPSTRFMDFAPVKRRPVAARPAAPAQPATPVRPAAAPLRPRPAQPAAKRPLSAGPQRPSVASSDPLSARPVSRPASPNPRPSAPRPVRPVSRPVAPRVIQSTTVKTVTADEHHAESFEFGIIEDLSPIVQPEPPMIPGSPVEEPRRPKNHALETPDHHSDDYLRVTPEPEPEKPSLFSRKNKVNATPKSPFLSSVSVPKRPLSASAPTGIHAPVTPSRPAAPAETSHPKKKRKNAPFIVIVILSVLLGVSLGALVYFVLPH